jgi:hypothetical protein
MNRGDLVAEATPSRSELLKNSIFISANVPLKFQIHLVSYPLTGYNLRSKLDGPYAVSNNAMKLMVDALRLRRLAIQKIEGSYEKKWVQESKSSGGESPTTDQMTGGNLFDTK